jgi:cyclohexanecarboxylate-CoA ligase
MEANRMWRDQTIDVFFRRALDKCQAKIAVVAYRNDREQPIRLSYRELDARVDCVARSLAALGVGNGNVVTYQLLNW